MMRYGDTGAAAGRARTAGSPLRAPQAGIVALAAVLAIAGCGGSSHHGARAARAPSSTTSASTSAGSTSTRGARRSTPTPAGGAAATPQEPMTHPGPDIELSSAGIARTGDKPVLAREYTCDGADRSPPVRWQGIPANAAEIALFVMNLKPVNGKLFFDWAVAGINPKLKGLQAGRLPPGAVQGRNGFGQIGYSVCPAGAAQESYVLVVFAPPRRLAPQSGFEPAAFRNEVVHVAPSAGLLGATYQRTG